MNKIQQLTTLLGQNDFTITMRNCDNEIKTVLLPYLGKHYPHIHDTLLSVLDKYNGLTIIWGREHHPVMYIRVPNTYGTIAERREALEDIKFNAWRCGEADIIGGASINNNWVDLELRIWWG